MFVPSRGPRYSESEARRAIAASLSYAEALRRLGMRAAGGNPVTLRKYADRVWHIPTDHFDPERARNAAIGHPAIPLVEILVVGSTYHRAHLKERLYRAGLKTPICEVCDQGEMWQGLRMSLILDHVNGVADDNRLTNLRIVCPNCNATLDTHCGRQNRLSRTPSRCLRCGQEFRPRDPRQRYCSRYCGVRAKGSGRGLPHLRRVVRPPYTHLLREVGALGFCATGRRYGVSDNAIRKWLRQYERELAAAAGPVIDSRGPQGSRAPDVAQFPQDPASRGPATDHPPV